MFPVRATRHHVGHRSAEPGRADVLVEQAGVGDRPVRGLTDEIEISAVVMNAERRRRRSDDGHVSCYRHGATFQKY